VDDRRRNPNLHHITHLRHLAERAFRVAIVGGAIAGWALIARACIGA